MVAYYWCIMANFVFGYHFWESIDKELDNITKKKKKKKKDIIHIFLARNNSGTITVSSKKDYDPIETWPLD